MPSHYLLNDAQATAALGSRLTACLYPGMIVYLRGELGAGKTTLVRGLLQSLGHCGTVKSPTYTLVEPYQIHSWQLFHWDLYRVADAEELEYLGLRDQLDGQALLLIEWPERATGALPAADLEIVLSYAESGRNCAVSASNSRAQAALNALAEHAAASP